MISQDSVLVTVIVTVNVTVISVLYPTLTIIYHKATPIHGTLFVTVNISTGYSWASSSFLSSLGYMPNP